MIYSNKPNDTFQVHGIFNSSKLRFSLMPLIFVLARSSLFLTKQCRDPLHIISFFDVSTFVRSIICLIISFYSTNSSHLIIFFIKFDICFGVFTIFPCSIRFLSLMILLQICISIGVGTSKSSYHTSITKSCHLSVCAVLKSFRVSYNPKVILCFVTSYLPNHPLGRFYYFCKFYSFAVYYLFCISFRYIDFWAIIYR